MLTLDELGTLWGSGDLASPCVIADIACDIDGAIEATYKATTPADPVFVYDVPSRRFVDGLAGDGPVVLAVDNLPAELPRESSQEFGDTLLPFIEPLDRCDWERPFEHLALPPELTRAIITHRGKLTPRFAYLEEALAEHGGN
jgi:alpha-aminoadipic semialdehyde synthase